MDKNLSIGKKCRFTGFTSFRPLPGSIIKIGKNCSFNSLPISNLIGVNRACMLSTLVKGAELIIEDNCGFSGTVVGAFSKIIIQEGVRCGANTLITDSDWHLDDYRSGEPSPVTIEKNVWLGEDVKVMKGVTIGENSVIGAGSIVVKSIPANVVAAGNPCKVIKNL
jgi:acetyltransferase-like isoleucine patch superfamily enzyme